MKSKKTSQSRKYRKSVFIVTYRKSKSIFGKEIIKYLVLKRKLHWKGWEFPKGGLETKEANEKTIRREMKEETGQSPFNIKKYPIQGKYKYSKILKDRPNIIGQTFKLFSAELKKAKVKLDCNEHSIYKWLEFDKAIKLLTYSNQRRCLRIVEKELR
jgi:8-oxo-dGTP pyrophosphatase MutT (NUDIX family)